MITRIDRSDIWDDGEKDTLQGWYKESLAERLENKYIDGREYSKLIKITDKNKQLLQLCVYAEDYGYDFYDENNNDIFENIYIYEEPVLVVVEDWAGRELKSFETEEDLVGDAMEYKDRLAESWVQKENVGIDTESEEYEKLFDEMLGDLYIVGYNVRGERVSLNFG